MFVQKFQKLIPAFGNVNHEGIVINWLGFHGTFRMGRFITGNPSDGGLLIKVKIPTGGKALALIDSGMGVGRIYAHALVGAETALGPGLSAGIGGSVGLTGIKWGLFTMSSTGFTKTKFMKMGRYATTLLELSDGFLKTLDTNNVTQ